MKKWRINIYTYMRKIFLEDLPRWEEGNCKGKINWEKSVGCKIKFIYTINKTTIKKTLEDYIEIIGYQNQRIITKYKNNIETIRTGDVLQCKIANLLKYDLYRNIIDKSKEKWIDFNNVPLNSKGIDWKGTINQKIPIPFKYNEFSGDLYILKYLDEKHLLVQYLNYEPFNIIQGNLLKCRLGGLLEVINYKYIYNVGDTVEGKYSNIKILELFRKENSGGLNVKWYKYKCLACNLENEIVETSLLNGTGCPVCTGKKVLPGINDICTTDYWMVKYFQGGEEEAKLYTSGSGKSIQPICPDCGTIRSKPIVISNLKKTKSIGCRCGDGISYPEKFMIELLNQLHMNYEYRKSFSWSDRKEYDFFIPYINTIIETHGEQHYKKSFHTIHKARTLEEEQDNDKFKENIAINNNIINYIVIDCQKSELQYIKNNILNSNLNILFDMSNINWDKCEEYALKNIVKEVCEIKKINSNYTSGDISKLANLSIYTIIRYLKLGHKLGWCVYDIKQERIELGKRMSGNLHPNRKKVVCLTTNEIFETATQAEVKYKICKIGECCNGNRKSAGKHPKTGEPLIWTWYKDYVKLQEVV